MQAENHVIYLDWKMWKDVIFRVNKQVNNNVKYKTDLELYNRLEFWTIINGKGFGDCEDYALTKRKQLLVEGAPPSSLSLATCWAEKEKLNYHATLIVRTTDGDYVLDNNFDKPMPADKVPFVWHKIQVNGVNQWRWAYEKDAAAYEEKQRRILVTKPNKE